MSAWHYGADGNLRALERHLDDLDRQDRDEEAVEAEVGRLLDDPEALFDLFNQADLLQPAYQILRDAAESRLEKAKAEMEEV